MKNIKALKKEEEEKITKVSLFKVIVGFSRDALFFNILD